ncbi:MAG: L-rhamnose isomerase [Actinobacteria bacterium]|nr:L-rhamnose isomerase [Actinomycetota bacterium]
MNTKVKEAYELARKQYTKYGMDTDDVLNKLKDIPVSINCWQGDDVGGFEGTRDILSGGGILSTGNYPGKAKNINELRSDIEKTFSLVPGRKRLNLHAIYGDFKGKVINRNEILPEHFSSWIDWAKKLSVGIDFNPTLFSHPLAISGYTLSSKNEKVRRFWIEHVKKCREISNYIGRELKIPCIMNIWIPDGSKDLTVSRLEHREILRKSLDEIFTVDYPEDNMLDALECKLFGIGSESYVVGSHEFYLSYAVKKDKLITFDTGHYHPTEIVSDKLSALFPFIRGILLHISRGVRWDSDHVPILTEELIAIMAEIIRADALSKVHIATDFFDGSINRIGAWVIGARAVLKSLLIALLEPTHILKSYEESGNLFARLGFLEALKSMPFGAVWDYYCESMGVLTETEWIDEVLKYEKEVTSKR